MTLCFRILSIIYNINSDILTKKMSINCKFGSAVEYSTLQIDGMHITLQNLNKLIIEQKLISTKNMSFDLIITNTLNNQGELLYLNLCLVSNSHFFMPKYRAKMNHVLPE